MRKLLWLIVCLMTMVVSANAQSYTPKEVKNLNLKIITLEADYKSDLSEIRKLKEKRDEMVLTFPKSDKTINFGMSKEEAKKAMEICGWWSKHSSSFTENGTIELLHFSVYNTFYVGENELTNDNNYMLTFENDKLKKIEVAENTADKWKTKIDDLEYRVRMLGR